MRGSILAIDKPSTPKRKGGGDKQSSKPNAYGPFDSFADAMVFLARYGPETFGLTDFAALLWVAERTLGYGKSQDSTSLGQMTDGITRQDGRIRGHSGLSRSAARDALKRLEARGVIHRERRRDGDRNDPNVYSIDLPALVAEVEKTLGRVEAKRWGHVTGRQRACRQTTQGVSRGDVGGMSPRDTTEADEYTASDETGTARSQNDWQSQICQVCNSTEMITRVEGGNFCWKCLCSPENGSLAWPTLR